MPKSISAVISLISDIRQYRDPLYAHAWSWQFYVAVDFQSRLLATFSSTALQPAAFKDCFPSDLGNDPESIGPQLYPAIPSTHY